MAGEKKLTPKQNKAVMALARGETVDATALAAGVSPRTVYRWRALPDFRQAIADQEAALLADLARRLTAASEDAIALLHETVNDKKASLNFRLRAALGILQYRSQFSELVTLADRVAALEAAQPRAAA